MTKEKLDVDSMLSKAKNKFQERWVRREEAEDLKGVINKLQNDAIHSEILIRLMSEHIQELEERNEVLKSLPTGAIEAIQKALPYLRNGQKNESLANQFAVILNQILVK